MKRTHKLRALHNVDEVLQQSGSISAAAKRLGVDRSTVHRWLQAGKVSDRRADLPPVAPAEKATSADAWRQKVCAAFTLSDTELQLVDLAVDALEMARDRDRRPEIRLAAMARYQALVKQVNLSVVQSGSVPKPAAPASTDPVVPKPVSGPRMDPRALLVATN